MMSTMWKQAAVQQVLTKEMSLRSVTACTPLCWASANESANALACHVSGSREAFAELMNQTAESLGCTGSHFANPSGLNDENHYTTAHDMALITRAAIQNPDFLEIDGARNYKLPPTKRNLEGGYVANHHRMHVKTYLYTIQGFCRKDRLTLPLR